MPNGRRERNDKPSKNCGESCVTQLQDPHAQNNARQRGYDCREERHSQFHGEYRVDMQECGNGLCSDESRHGKDGRKQSKACVIAAISAWDAVVWMTGVCCNTRF